METQNEKTSESSQLAISNLNHIEINSKTQSLAYIQLFLKQITRKIDTVQKIEIQDIQSFCSVKHYLDIDSMSDSDCLQISEFLKRFTSRLSKQLQHFQFQRMELRGIKSKKMQDSKFNSKQNEVSSETRNKKHKKYRNKKTGYTKNVKGVGKTVHGRCFGQNYLIPLPMDVIENANAVQKVKLPEIDPNMSTTERRQILKKRKLIQNRASVKACRIRKIGYKNSLEKEIQIMENEIKILNILNQIYSIMSQLKQKPKHCDSTQS